MGCLCLKRDYAYKLDEYNNIFAAFIKTSSSPNIKRNPVTGYVVQSGGVV